MSAIATDRRVGVIGMGHMAEALVSGAISAGVIKPDSVICSRRGRDALTRIADEMGVGVTRDNAEVVVSSDLVLLSVKPQQLQDVMPRLSAHWRPGQVLVSVMAGSIFDVAVDIRPGSPTRGEWVGVILTGSEPRQLWVPPGFAHGFCVMDGPATVHYRCTTAYLPTEQAGLAWDDPTIGIEWPIQAPILSQKDRDQPSF